MNKTQIDFLKSLDPNQESGTITNILLGNLGDLNTARYEMVLQYLCKALNDEKKVYMDENERMRKILVANNLYTSENMGIGQ